ncbi:MAG: helix-turn-helix domain-containing protein [Actinomycetota bacterium]|nr:helix-turn-helix domain-containing protein [Actinomycetota bacterium]MDA3018838.1 helix-turn-helix domain-containing protein [Actinomycetota bacterium]
MAVKTLQTVENALAVLEVVAELQPIGVSALARHMNMDKNTAQRILITLGASGYIQKQNHGTAWMLTPRVLTLSNRVAVNLRKTAREQLEELSEAIGETALLWQFTYVGGSLYATLLDKVESKHDVKITMEIGKQVFVRENSAETTNVRTLIDQFPTGESAWLNAANDDRPRYYRITPGHPNSIAIGSVIYDGPAQPVASISVVGPKERISPDCYKVMGEKTAAAARLITGI